MRIMRIHADVSANVALDSAMAESFAFLCAVQEQRGLTPSSIFGKKIFTASLLLERKRNASKYCLMIYNAIKWRLLSPTYLCRYDF